jgi:hypothetical protein
MLQSPVRSRLSTPNKKSHEKPSSKKERFLLLCSLLELHDLFPTCTPPEQLEPKSAAGSATRHAKRVKRWPGSAHDSCEICARVAANVYAKMNPARLSRRVYVARVANPRLPKRASDYAGLSHLEKVLQKKRRKTRRSWTKAGGESKVIRAETLSKRGFRFQPNAQLVGVRAVSDQVSFSP